MKVELGIPWIVIGIAMMILSGGALLFYHPVPQSVTRVSADREIVVVTNVEDKGSTATVWVERIPDDNGRYPLKIIEEFGINSDIINRFSIKKGDLLIVRSSYLKEQSGESLTIFMNSPITGTVESLTDKPKVITNKPPLPKRSHTGLLFFYFFSLGLHVHYSYLSASIGLFRAAWLAG